MFSAEESRVSHPAQANENLKVIRKFFVLFLLVGMDGMDSAFGRVPMMFHMKCLGGRLCLGGQSNEEETPTARQVCEDLWRF